MGGAITLAAFGPHSNPGSEDGDVSQGGTSSTERLKALPTQTSSVELATFPSIHKSCEAAYQNLQHSEK